MLLKWDHIIHHVDQLKNFTFPDEMLHVVSGGKHEQLGTYNQLSYFDLSYIEFIDVFDSTLLEEKSEHAEGKVSFSTSLKRTNFKEGFIRLCFRTDNIDLLRQTLEQKGYEIIGPLEMSRRKDDGSIISWRLLYINDARDDRELPFFIQWGSTDADRTIELMPYFQSAYVSEIELVTKDKEALIKEWEHMFDAVYDDGLIINDSPKFKVSVGEYEGIRSITIVSDTYKENTMEIHGALYHFKRRHNHTSEVPTSPHESMQ